MGECKYDGKTSGFQIVSLLLEISTIIVTITAGILGYFFIYKPQVEESKANIELSNVTTILSQIQADVAETKEELALKNQKTTLSNSLVSIVKMLRPNIKVDFNGDFLAERDKHSLRLPMQLENKGDVMVKVELFGIQIVEPNNISAEIVGCGFTGFLPPYEEEDDGIVELQLDSPCPEGMFEIEYKFIFNTDPAIVSIIAIALEGLIAPDIICNMGKFQYTRKITYNSNK